MEDKTLNYKCIDICFFLSCFSLMFCIVPQKIQMGVLGGELGGHLAFYPLFAGVMYSLYCQYVYKNVFIESKTFFDFVALIYVY